MKRARVPKPGEPDALTKTEQGRVERAAARYFRAGTTEQAAAVDRVFE